MKAVNEISPQRTELQSNLLDDNTLEYVEEKFPGVVRLSLTRRTRAVVRLKLKGYKRLKVISYHLPEPDDRGNCPLETESYYAEWLTAEYPDLWALAKHCACEGMLARRNGDKEHVRVSARKRASKKLELQQADT